MSLSTWFRDYVYIPLGGSRGSTWKQVRNVFIIFIVSGFWHGANWTFIAWGALNACFFLPLLLLKRNRNNTDNVAEGRWLPSFRELIQIGMTFGMTVLAWVFFRAADFGSSWLFIQGVFGAVTEGAKVLATADILIVLIVYGWIMVAHWLLRHSTHRITPG